MVTCKENSLSYRGQNKEKQSWQLDKNAEYV